MLFHSWQHLLIVACGCGCGCSCRHCLPLSVNSISNFTVSVRCHFNQCFYFNGFFIQISIHTIHTLHDPFIFDSVSSFFILIERKIVVHIHIFIHCKSFGLNRTFHWMIWHISENVLAHICLLLVYSIASLEIQTSNKFFRMIIQIENGRSVNAQEIQNKDLYMAFFWSML